MRSLWKTITRCIAPSIILMSASHSNEAAAEEVLVDAVAIVVNEDAILVSDLNAALKPFRDDLLTRFSGAEYKGQLEDALESVVNILIEGRLLAQTAQRAGIGGDDKSADQALAAFQKGFPSQAAFEQFMAERRLTLDEVRNEVQRDRLIATVRSAKLVELERTSEVNRQEILDFYEKNKATLSRDKETRVSQIFIGLPEEHSKEDVERAGMKAEEVLDELRQGGVFAEYARRYSDGRRGVNGGDMGYFKAGELMAELDEAVSNLKEGALSDVIRSERGFHILKITGRTGDAAENMPKVMSLIENNLRARQATEKFGLWLAELKSQSHIERHI